VNGPKCCGQPAQIFENVDVGGKPGTGFLCDVCGNKASAVNRDDAEKEFIKNAKAAPKKEPKKEQKKMEKIPDTSNVNKVMEKLKAMDGKLMKLATPMLMKNKGDYETFRDRNMRYVINADLGKVWETEEGQASVIHEVEEAFIFSAELGVNADLVPFGKTCKLIKSYELMEFVLTDGDNPIFKWIIREAKHVNDELTIMSRAGNFEPELKHAEGERGEVEKVIVYGLHTQSGRVLGDSFDVSFLMEKAADHSSSYQYYLSDKQAYEEAKASNNIKTWPSGDKYFEAFGKKISVKNIKNPYDSSDKEKMLLKTAGKSFLGPFMKTVLSKAATVQARTHEEARDQAINGFDQTLSGEAEEV
jgi:hypothetical protein